MDIEEDESEDNEIDHTERGRSTENIGNLQSGENYGEPELVTGSKINQMTSNECNKDVNNFIEDDCFNDSAYDPYHDYALEELLAERQQEWDKIFNMFRCQIFTNYAKNNISDMDYDEGDDFNSEELTIHSRSREEMDSSSKSRHFYQI